MTQRVVTSGCFPAVHREKLGVAEIVADSEILGFRGAQYLYARLWPLSCNRQTHIQRRPEGSLCNWAQYRQGTRTPARMLTALVRLTMVTVRP